MEKFFNPKSIVVVGSSNSPFNLGATISNILQYLKYDGTTFVVNSKGEDVHGSKGYPSVLDIPGDVDLAVVLTPAAIAPRIIKECGQKGIKNVIIETAEFAEAGRTHTVSAF